MLKDLEELINPKLTKTEQFLYFTRYQCTEHRANIITSALSVRTPSRERHHSNVKSMQNMKHFFFAEGEGLDSKHLLKEAIIIERELEHYHLSTAGLIATYNETKKANAEDITAAVSFC